MVSFGPSPGRLKYPCGRMRMIEVGSERSPGQERRFGKRERDGPGEEDFDEESGDIRYKQTNKQTKVSAHASRQRLRSARLLFLLSLGSKQSGSQCLLLQFGFINFAWR